MNPPVQKRALLRLRIIFFFICHLVNTCLLCAFQYRSRGLASSPSYTINGWRALDTTEKKKKKQGFFPLCLRCLHRKSGVVALTLSLSFLSFFSISFYHPPFVLLTSMRCSFEVPKPQEERSRKIRHPLYLIPIQNKL